MKYVFVDESGTHRQVRYSSFALVYVSVKDATAFEEKILALEKRIGIFRFHWANTDWEKRKLFFTGLLDLEWEARVGIVENPVLPDAEMERMMYELLSETKLHTLFIDGKKTKRYERKMKKVLRDKGISSRKLKTVDDSRYAGIRVADALAGLFRAYFDGKEHRMVREWCEKLKKKHKVLVTQ